MSLSVCPCLCAVSVYTVAVCCGDEGRVCVGSQPAVFLTVFRNLDVRSGALLMSAHFFSGYQVRKIRYL